MYTRSTSDTVDLADGVAVVVTAPLTADYISPYRALGIIPASSIEEEVYGRIVSGIPSGDFYLRAEYVQPRWGGTAGRVPFWIFGTPGHHVEVLINGAATGIYKLSVSQETVFLPLLLPPDINDIRARDLDDVSEEAGCSVAITNYASVHYGASLDYYRHVWRPYQVQRDSLLSDWSCRLVEFYFKYHQLMPDTAALRTLAVRLTSRALWNDATNEQGVRDAVAALCCSEPVVTPLDPCVAGATPQERGDNFVVDLALFPLLPVSTDYSGFEFDVWLPDLPTAREVALLKLTQALPQRLGLSMFQEGRTHLTIDSEPIHLVKDTAEMNLQYLLRQIGPMDAWRGFGNLERDADSYRRFWSRPFDRTVRPPGLGAVTFDTGTFDSRELDQSDPFTELWNNLPVGSLDDMPFDSLVQRVVCAGEVSQGEPSLWAWDCTAIEGAAYSGSGSGDGSGGSVPGITYIVGVFDTVVMTDDPPIFFCFGGFA